MRISVWSSDVCSSDLFRIADRADAHVAVGQRDQPRPAVVVAIDADVAGVAAGAAFDAAVVAEHRRRLVARVLALELELAAEEGVAAAGVDHVARAEGQRIAVGALRMPQRRAADGNALAFRPRYVRSEEHTSELQSLMRTSYAVFCLKKKKQ